MPTLSYETHPNYLKFGYLQAFRGRILTIARFKLLVVLRTATSESGVRCKTHETPEPLYAARRCKPHSRSATWPIKCNLAQSAKTRADSKHITPTTPNLLWGLGVGRCGRGLRGVFWRRLKKYRRPKGQHRQTSQ